MDRNNENTILDDMTDIEEESGNGDISASVFNTAPGDDITLESILAEYKGSAYIDGDKRTPAAILHEKTEKIVLEAADGHFGETSINIDSSRRTETERTKPLPSLEEIKTGSTKPLPTLEGIKAPKEPVSDSKNVISIEQYTEKNRHGAGRPAAKPSTTADGGLDEIARQVEQAIEDQTKLEEDTEKSARKLFGLFSRKKYRETEYGDFEDEPYEPYEEEEDASVSVIEEEVVEEPDYKAALKIFAQKCNLYSMRSFVSLVLTAVMAILTVVFQSGAPLPLVGDNRILNAGILLILLLVVMMFSIDHLFSGLLQLFKGRNGVDALNLFSCLATIASAGYTLITKDTTTGVPFCVVSAFSLSFTLWGEKVHYRALTETMKTALSVGAPYGVIAEMSRDLDRTVIKKVSGRTAGFYTNLIQADVSEVAFNYAAPILIVSSVVLGLYTSFGSGQGHYFLHNLAAVMAAAAPFSAVAAYAIPFAAINKSTRPSGATIAGWGGADDLYHSDGASITDEDLFPQGTVSLGGARIFDEAATEKALRYTASLIIASNSGLSKLFSDMLSKQGMNMIRVEEFTCYEGGVGGTIRGERIFTGSAAFMNLQGIRVPGSLNLKNAIFTAVNKKLIAAFSINYEPGKNVQNALISILRYRVKLYFAIRDFNITPVMLEQKFKVSIDNVEYIPIKESYDISDDAKQEAKRVSAVLTREGMGPYVEAITGGRRLIKTATIATVFSLVSAVGGMLIMAVICWTGMFSSASAGNLMLYMLSMLVIDLIICGFAKYRQ